MQYEVSISIPPAALEEIYAAGQSVTLVKGATANVTAAGALPVAWVTFQPLEENQIAWVADYSIFASNAILTPGAVVQMNTITDGSAKPGWLYVFQNYVFNGQPGSGNTYNASNQTSSPNLMCFGLAQNVGLNGVGALSPINAVPVLYNEEAAFTPQEEISIFLSNFSNSGAVLNQVPSNALTVTLSSVSPDASVGFNIATNTFYLLSNKR